VTHRLVIEANGVSLVPLLRGKEGPLAHFVAR
jgi:hypothetical protein